MNKYVYKGISSGAFYGPFAADSVVRAAEEGKYPRDLYELFELVPAKIIPPNEAKVVRA